MDMTVYPLIAGVTWLLLRGPYVLLEQCPKKARVLGFPNEWFVPGDKVEWLGDRYETPDEALVREVREEWPTLAVTRAVPLPIVEGSPVGKVDPAKGVFLMRPYAIEVSGEIPTVSSEGTPLMWTPVDVALRSPVPQVRMMIAAAWYGGAL